jgi:integrase/recombinase XerC
VDFDEIVATVKRDMRRRGLLESSIAKRVIALRALHRWLGNETPLLDVTTEQIETFLDEREIGPRTRHNWLVHLGVVLEWAVGEGLIEMNPTAKIVRPKLRRTLPRPAPTEDLRRLLDVTDIKQRCWVLLAAYQGLRCQEIAGLRREDVIEADSLLRIVHGKGGHERMLPLHPDVLSALRSLPMPRVGWIFTRERGGRYTPNAMSKFFNRFLHEQGVDATAHQLRHWFGTQLYNSTNDLRLTQEMLGHSDPAITAIYTAFNHRAAAVAIRDLSFGSDSGTELAVLD